MAQSGDLCPTTDEICMYGCEEACAIAPRTAEPGPVTVIGPECFASADHSVICWQGVNYYREPDDDELARVFVAMEGMTPVEVLAQPTCFDSAHEHLASSCEVRDELRARIEAAILNEAATWEVQFDGGAGQVVGVSDAAFVAAKVAAPYGADWPNPSDVSPDDVPSTTAQDFERAAALVEGWEASGSGYGGLEYRIAHAFAAERQQALDRLEAVRDAHDWGCDCTPDDPCRILIALDGGPSRPGGGA